MINIHYLEKTWKCKLNILFILDVKIDKVKGAFIVKEWVTLLDNAHKIEVEEDKDHIVMKEEVEIDTKEERTIDTKSMIGKKFH